MYWLCPIMFLATAQLLVLVFFVCLFAYLLTRFSLCACTLFLLHDDNSLCMSRLQCFAMLSNCLCRCCYCLIIFPLFSYGLWYILWLAFSNRWTTGTWRVCACLLHCNGDAHIFRSGEIFLPKEIYLFICFVHPFYRLRSDFISFLFWTCIISRITDHFCLLVELPFTVDC